MKKIIVYIITTIALTALILFAAVKLVAWKMGETGEDTVNALFSNSSLVAVLIMIAFVMSVIIVNNMSFFVKSKTPVSVPHVGSNLFYEKYTNLRCRVHRYEYDENGKVIDADFAFADENGNIYTKWYKGVSQYFDCGAAIVYDGEKYNIIDLEGKQLSNMWFDEIGTEVSDNCVKVYYNNDNTMNFLDLTTGKVLWKEWKEEAKQEITLP